MKLGVRIQTGGKRPRWTQLLYTLLENEGLFNTLKIIRYPNLWQCCRHVLLSAEDDETHLLVLQDDVLPCKDFLLTVDYLIKQRPDEHISIFSNHDNIDIAYAEKINWLKLRVWFMAQAYIIPVKRAKEMVAWIDENVKSDVALDDDRMATYIWFNQLFVYVTVPSLVEHIGWNDTTLRVYKNDLKKKVHRMARRFIGFEKSGMDINWKNLNPLIVNEGLDSQFISNLKTKNAINNA